MSEENPFRTADPDRHAIWEMLVRRDSDFFLGGDWALVAADYVDDGFIGIDAAKSLDPGQWRLAYPTVASYRDAAIAARWPAGDFAEPLRPAWFRCQSLSRIEIAGDGALAHKRVDGSIRRKTGSPMELAWRSVFYLRRLDGRWKIVGFTGYLPL